MVSLLPKVIEVSSRAANVAHAREEAPVEAATALETKLGDALDGAAAVHTDEAVLEDGAYYSSNHADQLAYVKSLESGAPRRAERSRSVLGSLFGASSPPKVLPSYA